MIVTDCRPSVRLSLGPYRHLPLSDDTCFQWPLQVTSAAASVRSTTTLFLLLCPSSSPHQSPNIKSGVGSDFFRCTLRSRADAVLQPLSHDRGTCTKSPAPMGSARHRLAHGLCNVD
jgi:hypothetical protein